MSLLGTVSANGAKQAAVEQEKMIIENVVKVYPTPARDVINVVLPDAIDNKEAIVSIHSMDGKLLQSTKLSGATSMQLNVSKLSAGVYTLRIASKKHVVNKVITIAK